jgi:hypothetical protein
MPFLNNVDEPKMDVPTPEITARRAEQLARIAKLEAELPIKFPRRLKADWTTPAAVEIQSEAGNTFEQLSDGSFLVEGNAADKDTYTLSFATDQNPITHVQLQVLPDDSLQSSGPGRSDSGNLVVSCVEILASPADGSAEPVTLKVKRASADFSQNDFPAWNVLDGRDNTGWGISGSGNWHVGRTLTLEL